jgi:hypothetical protein
MALRVSDFPYYPNSSSVYTSSLGMTVASNRFLAAAYAWRLVNTTIILEFGGFKITDLTNYKAQSKIDQQ